MQPTEKYYEHDAYCREAVGHILAAEPDSRTGGGRIALDGTVFYPEGGGQPADRGTLTLADGTVLTVTDVHEQAGVIWHMVTSLPAGAVPGAEAAQAIDWAWRFDKMQQHTGEHILSGILHSMFGAENVGFHIGSDAVRMDTNIPISAEGLKAAETAANRIIWENVPVNITYPTRGAGRPDLPLQKGDRGAGADRDHPRGGCLCLLRHPHRLYRRGGPDQDSGRRKL